MVKILKVMTLNLLMFMLLWLMILVFYLCVGMLIFYGVKEFKSIESSFVYLVSSALGNWDAEIWK